MSLCWQFANNWDSVKTEKTLLLGGSTKLLERYQVWKGFVPFREPLLERKYWLSNYYLCFAGHWLYIETGWQMQFSKSALFTKKLWKRLWNTVKHFSILFDKNKITLWLALRAKLQESLALLLLLKGHYWWDTTTTDRHFGHECALFPSLDRKSVV